MPRLDETRPFLPVNIALLTVSDTRDAAQDRSGNTLADLATTAGHHIAARRFGRDLQHHHAPTRLARRQRGTGRGVAGPDHDHVELFAGDVHGPLPFQPLPSGRARSAGLF